MSPGSGRTKRAARRAALVETEVECPICEQMTLRVDEVRPVRGHVVAICTWHTCGWTGLVELPYERR